MKRSLSRSLWWLIAIPLAAFLLWWSLRGIQWPAVWRSLTAAQPLQAGVCCLLISVNLFLRAVRWRILLGSQGPVGVPAAFWATAGGYLGNSFLPARAGEVVRTVMISKRTGFSNAFVLTTAICERMIDAMALIAISASVLLVLPTGPGWMRHAARPFAAAGLAGILVIATLPRFRSGLENLLSRLPLPESLRGRLSHLLGQVTLGLRSFYQGGRLLRFAAMTALIWLLDGAATMAGARSLGLSMSLPVALLLVAALGLGSALPSTPGFIGVYQFVAVSVLTPLGFKANDAIAYILLFQALQYAAITFWGLLAVWQAKARAAASPGSGSSPAVEFPVG